MTCLGSGTGTNNCGPAYLFFDGQVSRYVDCGSPAQLDDLPNNDFTLDGWVRADGYGGLNAGHIVWKAPAAPLGWAVQITNGGGLRATAVFGGADADSNSVAADFDADSIWHHIAAVFDSAAGTFDLYVDGTEVTYALQQAGAAGYSGDAAGNLLIGNTALLTAYWEGAIGWLRISDNQRWTANFTAPARCTLPTTDANTLGIWIYEGTGLRTYNLAGDYGNGDLNVNPLWACDCAIANDPTCDNEIYIANKSNFANITHAYWYDASAAAYSANLQNASLPHLLFPPVPAAGDYLYIGCDTAVLNSGPFVSLVFDIGTAQVNLGAITWEYWNGAAWAALTVQDNTNSMLNLGVNSIHWEQPTTWATTAVNGVTAYWVRATGSFPGGATTPPQQQNRHIYTITWSHLNIDADQINGDVEKLITIQIDNTSDADAQVGAPPFSPELWANRALIGARSVRRGTSYTPYINLANEQNHADITVTNLTANVTFFGGTPRRGPAENHCRYNPAAAVIALQDEVQVDLGDTISPEYKGRFQLYMRVYNDTTGAGSPDDFEVRVRMILGESTGLAAFTSETITTANENTPELIYLGFIEITDDNYTNGITWSDVSFIIELGHTSTDASLLWLYDLILFPVDEWSGDFIDPNWENSPLPGLMGGQLTDERTRLLVDSVTNPKNHIQALLLNLTTETEQISPYRHAANERASLSNTRYSGTHGDVRLYFLFESATFDPGSLPDTLYFASKYEVAARVQITGKAQYLGMRGDR